MQTQLALANLKTSRELLFVPALLVPEGWVTSVVETPQVFYKAGLDIDCWSYGIMHQLLVFLSQQVVAAFGHQLVSVFDGTTKYKVGQTLHAKRGGAAWAPLDACYFSFPTMQQVHHSQQQLSVLE